MHCSCVCVCVCVFVYLCVCVCVFRLCCNIHNAHVNFDKTIHVVAKNNSICCL